MGAVNKKLKSETNQEKATRRTKAVQHGGEKKTRLTQERQAHLPKQKKKGGKERLRGREVCGKRWGGMEKGASYWSKLARSSEGRRTLNETKDMSTYWRGIF